MGAESVLITGGCGFLGQHLANHLVHLGYRPVLFGRREKRQLLEPGLEAKACPYAAGDVLELAELMEAATTWGVRSIVHSAAMLPPDTERMAYQATQVNIQGSVNVYETAIRLGLGRVTLVSSGAVYAPEPAPCREDALLPLDMPYGFYGCHKAAAEMIGLKYAQQFGLDFVSTRHGAIYGPGGTSPHYLNFLVSRAVRGESAKLEAGADHRFEFVHVQDAVRGLALIHLAPRLAHRVYNIGAGESHSLSELAEMIKRHIPGAHISLGPGLLPHLPQRRPFDIFRAREAGYAPEWDLERGLADLIGSFK